MAEFNDGKPYHGSKAVMGGKLKGATDTDHFYFFCPRCPENYVLRVLDYGVHSSSKTNPHDQYDKTRSKSAKGFVLVFQIYCEQCGLKDFVKVGNYGTQSGPMPIREVD